MAGLFGHLIAIYLPWLNTMTACGEDAYERWKWDQWRWLSTKWRHRAFGASPPATHRRSPPWLSSGSGAGSVRQRDRLVEGGREGGMEWRIGMLEVVWGRREAKSNVASNLNPSCGFQNVRARGRLCVWMRVYMWLCVFVCVSALVGLHVYPFSLTLDWRDQSNWLSRKRISWAQWTVY